MANYEKTRQLAPVYVEKREGEDIRDLLYVKDEKGAFKSLREIQATYEVEQSPEIPGLLTTNIIETAAERGTTIKSVSVSPFQVCCVYVNGYKICFQC